MGAPMALQLHKNDFEVTAWNRSAKKLEPLAQAGVQTVDSAQSAIAATDITLTMLSDAAAIESVILADAKALTGKTILQMGTIAPGESRKIQSKVEAAGGQYIEAHELGNIGA